MGWGGTKQYLYPNWTCEKPYSLIPNLPETQLQWSHTCSIRGRVLTCTNAIPIPFFPWASTQEPWSHSEAFCVRSNLKLINLDMVNKDINYIGILVTVLWIIVNLNPSVYFFILVLIVCFDILLAKELIYQPCEINLPTENWIILGGKLLVSLKQILDYTLSFIKV